jgi:predicted O-linked N-acetylglucosamine transferase (SPINDLY family)
MSQLNINDGILLHQNGKLVEARIIYEKILENDNKNSDALHLMGLILFQIGNSKEALIYIDKAINIKPNIARYYSSKGIVLHKNKLFNDAIDSYNIALDIDAKFADAYTNRGLALHEIKKYSDALQSYNKAISINPKLAITYANKGNLLKQIKNFKSAIYNFEKALEINSNFDYLKGTLLHLKMCICDWKNFNDNLNYIIQGVQKNEKVSPPFPLITLTSSLPLQYQTSKNWAADKYQTTNIQDSKRKNPAHHKIRIGYFSSDFYNHATAHLITGLFEMHDKDKFDLFGFSLVYENRDANYNRIFKCFNQFINVANMSDESIAALSRSLEIDIAIDLKGFTQDNRFGIFSNRAAPIQVNYLGYPGTLGADYFDYVIADKIVIPTESKIYYSEKIVYLPFSYQVNDNNKIISTKTYTRRELSLPEEGFIFCSFNNNFKINPHIFDVWVRILNEVNSSVLWLLEDNPFASNNLRKEAQNRGINPSRLVFAKRTTLAEHLARHKVADLFLDTLPYNAHTTASDALWAGLPVLTCMGESFASRVAGSLLTAIGLPELITTTENDYVTLAIELATKPAKLKEFKEKLGRNRLSTPLFDTARFTTNIEAAYTEMYERYLSDLPLEHIFISDSVVNQVSPNRVPL